MRAKKKSKRKTQRAQRLPKNRALLAVLSAAVFLVVAAVLANPTMRGDVYGVLGVQQEAPSLQSMETESEAAFLQEDGVAVVTFLDVGQGDAVLLECGGEYALIDAGPAAAKADLLADLQMLGVASLRYLVMTHPHEDHIGGMQTVLENFAVENVLLPDFTKAELPTTATFEELMQSFLERELPSEVMHEGAQYPLGEGTLEVLCGSLENEENYNLLSPVLLFEMGNFQYLSAGDAERENEEYALLHGVPLAADLFKASHHGSSTSNTLPFMQAVQPALTVIPCGEDNRYGHPHREVLDIFAQVQTQTLSTAENGLVRVLANGQGQLQVQAEVPVAA